MHEELQPWTGKQIEKTDSGEVKPPKSGVQTFAKIPEPGNYRVVLKSGIGSLLRVFKYRGGLWAEGYQIDSPVSDLDIEAAFLLVPDTPIDPAIYKVEILKIAHVRLMMALGNLEAARHRYSDWPEITRDLSIAITNAETASWRTGKVRDFYEEENHE